MGRKENTDGLFLDAGLREDDMTVEIQDTGAGNGHVGKAIALDIAVVERERDVELIISERPKMTAIEKVAQDDWILSGSFVVG